MQSVSFSRSPPRPQPLDAVLPPPQGLGPPSLLEESLSVSTGIPKTRIGRRCYLTQVVTLALLPVVALIVQNCSSMLRVSRDYDDAVSIRNEIKATVAVGGAVTALQMERVAIAYYIFKEGTRKSLEGTFNETDQKMAQLPSHGVSPEVIGDLTSESDESLASRQADQVARYASISGNLLDVMALRIATTATGNIWRELCASAELLRAVEHASAGAALGMFYFVHGELDKKTYARFVRHDALATDHLSAARQLAPDASSFLNTDYCPICFVSRNQVYHNSRRAGNTTAAEIFMEAMSWYIDTIRMYQKHLTSTIESMVAIQMWQARRSQAVGATLLVLVLVVSPIIIALVRHATQTIQKFASSLETRTLELRSEKQKSDRLLRQMLPAAVIRQLRLRRAVPAESFECVTVYFSDIAGFTELAASSSAMEVVNMLNSLYRLFDSRILKHDVYKVETIGDAYMVASGLPQRNGDRHAGEIADMALELMAGLAGYRIPHRPGESLRARAGVHTGPCVAGVVGTAMPRYCLFGDTVNTASRMESTGEEMKIHISATTKEHLDKLQAGYMVEPRGKMDIKGKGEMDTFWLVGKEGEDHTFLDDYPDLTQEPEFLNIIL